MTPREKIVSSLRIAAEAGIYSGLIRTPADAAYLRRCAAQHMRDGASLIFTRDTGHHSAGWWKNPDYERCYHLSLAFFDPEHRLWRPFDKREGERWARMFFGHDLNLVWIEPPYTPEGRIKDVHHYRLFCDPGWQPIKPRGEVYSKQFTEIGWKSFSEIHGEQAQQFEHAMGDGS